MEITIQERVKNAELNREEVTFLIEHDNAQTPARSTVISKLAAIVNSEKERTILKEIKGQFGQHQSIGYANLYDSPEDAVKTEPKHILKRNGLVEEDAS